MLVMTCVTGRVCVTRMVGLSKIDYWSESRVRHELLGKSMRDSVNRVGQNDW